MFFMLQVKFVLGVDSLDLTECLNRTLSNLKHEVIDVKFPDNTTAAIIYEIKEEYKDRICCDCSLWDDTTSTSNLIGLCQFCGKRKRFNDKACRDFKDIRK